jgi:hypothetical protein
MPQFQSGKSNPGDLWHQAPPVLERRRKLTSSPAGGTAQFALTPIRCLSRLN